jgi:hypothetical protein
VADIFLSYSKRDIALAKRIVRALLAEGLSVWWDEDAGSGEPWDDAIKRELESAKAVLVLWTPLSVKSEWVRNEAYFARNCTPSKLVQARLADCEVPLAFSLRQYADLDRDRPDSGEGWQLILRWLRDTLAGKGTVASADGWEAPPSSRRPVAAHPLRGWLSSAGAWLATRRMVSPVPAPDGDLPLKRWLTVSAGLAGALLFSAFALYAKFGNHGNDPRDSALCAAIFSFPLVVALRWQRQIGWLGIAYFIVGLTAANVCAVIVADEIFPKKAFCLFCGEETAAQRDARAATAPRAGLEGGATGAFLSFLGLSLLSRRFREKRRLQVMILVLPVLSLLGMIGLSGTPPDEKLPIEYVYRLFLPWQALFGVTLALLFDDKLMRQRRTGAAVLSPPASPSRAA